MYKRLMSIKENSIIIISILVSIVSFIVSDQLSAYKVWHGVFYELGVALLIGAYLSVTIDKIYKEKKDNEINEYINRVGENFVMAVYGNNLPVELYNIVRSTIFDCKFIRTNYTADISLHDFDEAYINSAPDNIQQVLNNFLNEIQKSCTPSDGSKACLLFPSKIDKCVISDDTDKHHCECTIKNLIIMKLSMHYEVQNVATHKELYEVVFGVEKPFAGDHEGLCGITSIVIDEREIIEEPVCYKSNIPGGGDPSMLVYKHPIELVPNQKIKVDLEAYSLRFNDDQEPWVSVIPSRGASVSVTDENGNKDITISFRAALKNKSVSFVQKNPKTNKATLTTEQFLLPYQSIQIKWSTK